MLKEIKHEERESVTLYNEGEKLFGILHRPLGKESFPVVLFCHGLAGHKTGRYRIYVELAEALTAQGIGVLRVDFRGSGDSEGDFSSMTLASEVSDARVALEWLQKAPGINPDKIGIFGRSLGGTVAVIAASQFENIKSIALWAPVFSGDQWVEAWKSLELSSHPNQHEDLRTINGQVVGIPFYEELFAMKMEDNLKKLENIPLLHIHGLKDSIVYPIQADWYQKARNGSPSLFFLYDKSDHDFTFMPERKKAIQETSLWFLKTLLG